MPKQMCYASSYEGLSATATLQKDLCILILSFCYAAKTTDVMTREERGSYNSSLSLGGSKYTKPLTKIFFSHGIFVCVVSIDNIHDTCCLRGHTAFLNVDSSCQYHVLMREIPRLQDGRSHDVELTGQNGHLLVGGSRGFLLLDHRFGEVWTFEMLHQQMPLGQMIHVSRGLMPLGYVSHVSHGTMHQQICQMMSASALIYWLSCCYPEGAAPPFQ